MRLQRLWALSLAAALISAVGGGVAGAGSTVTDGGVLLTGVEAAHARFVAPVDACHGLELVVGYVEADRLQNPLGSGRPHFHSDVESILTVFENADEEECGSDSLQLSGTEGITESDQAEIVPLQSASLDGFGMVIEGVESGIPVVVILTLDLDWIAFGSVSTQVNNETGSHSANREVQANVEASVLINSVTGGGDLATALAALQGNMINGLEQTEGRIIHGQGGSINLP